MSGRVTVQDVRIECVDSENVRVDSTKRSLFIQIHVVSDCILKLRIPLLYAVCFVGRRCDFFRRFYLNRLGFHYRVIHYMSFW